MPMQLIPSPVSQDLEAVCRDLLEGVRTGQITGLGVVVMLRRRRFFVDAHGELARRPHEARGLIASLDDSLRDLARRRDGAPTTM